MGYILRINDDFTSVPGLKIYIDSRYSPIIDGNNTVLSLKDLSGSQLTFAKSVKNPKYEYPYIKQTNLDGGNTLFGSTGGVPKNFEFLHNGSAYGFYHLWKCDNLFNASLTSFATRSATTFPGFSFENQSLGTSARYRIRHANDTDLNFVRFQPKSYSASTTLDYVYNVHYGAGITNGYRLGEGNGTLYVNTTTPATGYSNNTGLLCRMLQTGFFDFNTPTNIHHAVLLIYDWTGYNSSTIDQFHSKVISLMNNIKNVFLSLE